MSLFRSQSEDEKFVRANCLFLTTYSQPVYRVFARTGSEPEGEAFLEGEGRDSDEAFANLKKELVQRLAYLEKVTSDVSGRISGTGAKFAEILDTASSQMISDLGKASEAFSEGLHMFFHLRFAGLRNLVVVRL